MEQEFESDKFDDCIECKNRFCELTCETCDYGESFEPDDMEEVDAHFDGRI
jgi:hypothetical protein